MLTALRPNEVADANCAEFDLPKREWTIPAARMKGRPGKARPHLHGDYPFSSTLGAKAIWISSAVKARLDATCVAACALAVGLGQAYENKFLHQIFVGNFWRAHVFD
jgi:hypothetical protein